MALVQCTFHANAAYRGGGFATGALGLRRICFDRVIITGSTLGEAIFRVGGTITLTCCDLHGNAGGDWVGWIADQYGVNGNFSEDPLFCDPAYEDFTLAAISPCAPEHSPGGCGLIGAWPVGCEVPQAAIGSGGPLWSTPNPFVGGTMIAYRISPGSTDGISVAIYDVAGRLLRTLWGDQGSGTPGRVWWDGTDAAGNAVPGGMYLLRLPASGRTATERVIKIK